LFNRDKMIIKKEFSWLEERVPNIKEDLAPFTPLFKLGGIIKARLRQVQMSPFRLSRIGQFML